MPPVQGLLQYNTAATTPQATVNEFNPFHRFSIQGVTKCELNSGAMHDIHS